MGYSTDFYGSFWLDRALDKETRELLVGLAETRRMKRDPKKLEAMGFGPAERFGEEGEFFFNPEDFEDAGQSKDHSILDYNRPPGSQGGLWLHWRPSEDGMEIEWDGGEKTYGTEEWIPYLIRKILAPRGYVLNGVANAQGDEPGDQWHLVAEDNRVSVGSGFHPGAEQPEPRWDDEEGDDSVWD